MGVIRAMVAVVDTEGEDVLVFLICWRWLFPLGFP